MRSERLVSEERAIVGYRGFKASGVDAPLWEPAAFLACFLIADAGDFSQDVSEPAAEDVAFVFGHPQRFADGVGEAVAGEAEVWEHGEAGDFFHVIDEKREVPAVRQNSSCSCNNSSLRNLRGTHSLKIADSRPFRQPLANPCDHQSE